MNYLTATLLVFFSLIINQRFETHFLLDHVNRYTIIDTSYSVLKREIISTRDKIKEKPTSDDSLSSVFTSLLTHQLLPRWHGTPWSFEGHTALPGEGEIACGYFVSTTLRDMGFNLNRYKFAQQLPIYEAKTLSLGEPLIEVSNPNPNERIKQLRLLLQDGIYFIGFDQSHVGYIQKKGDDLFVIHSNYINAEGVVKEKAEESIVFSYYSKLYLAPISTNIPLLQKWINNEEIAIVTH